MKAQHQLISTWNAVSQWLAQTILSPAIRRYTLYVAVLTCMFVLCLLGVAALHQADLSALHTQAVSALHQVNKLPYSIPWP